MAIISMYDFTREYYRVPLTLLVNGVEIDPTALSAEFSVLDATARPSDDSTGWQPGSWESYGGFYYSRILVGDAGAATAGGFQITAGTIYNVWWRITDSPERPARLVGQIQAI